MQTVIYCRLIYCEICVNLVNLIIYYACKKKRNNNYQKKNQQTHKTKTWVYICMADRKACYSEKWKPGHTLQLFIK